MYHLLRWPHRRRRLSRVEPYPPGTLLHIKSERQEGRLLGRSTCVTPGLCPMSLVSLVAESRHVQQLNLKLAPSQLNYAPDGKTILYTTLSRQLGVLTFGKEGDDTKDQWHHADIGGVRIFPPATHATTHDLLRNTFLRLQRHSTMSATASS